MTKQTTAILTLGLAVVVGAVIGAGAMMKWGSSWMSSGKGK